MCVENQLERQSNKRKCIMKNKTGELTLHKQQCEVENWLMPHMFSEVPLNQMFCCSWKVNLKERKQARGRPRWTWIDDMLQSIQVT